MDKHEKFKELADKLIEYLNKEHNPHTYIVISTDGAEILSGEFGYTNEDYIKD